MRNPLRKDDYHESAVGCKQMATGGSLIVLAVLGGLGYLAFYGVTEFLSRL